LAFQGLGAWITGY